MPKPSSTPQHLDPRTNYFLARLGDEDLTAVMTDATIVSLKFRKRLIRQDEQVDAVYFPLTCMISLLVTSNDEPQMEMATIGKEGVVGATEVAQGQGAIGLNLVQIPGCAVRIAAEAFGRILTTRPLIDRMIHGHMYALMRQILFGAACNRLHSMKERCARWLLMTHDRAGVDTFPLTQEFLSHMLGVRRATVNVATGALKRAGCIRYVRGKITVVDRTGLEAASCDCYASIVKVYQSFLPDAPQKAN